MKSKSNSKTNYWKLSTLLWGLLRIQKRQKSDFGFRFFEFDDERRFELRRISSNLVDQTHEKATTEKHASWLYQSVREFWVCFFCFCFCSLCVSVFLMQKVLTIQSLFMRAITLLVFSFFFALLVIYGQIVEILVHTHKATKNGKTKLIKYD